MRRVAAAFLGLLALANGSSCSAGMTICPAGCCPFLDAYCCENNWQCGQTPDGSDCCTGSISDSPDCPDIPTKAKQLVKLNSRVLNLDRERSCPGGGTDCPPYGCCNPNEPDWFCCPDSYFCAATKADCP